MTFLAVTICCAVAVLTLVRVVALSPLANKLTKVDVWGYDVGPKWGWLIFGIVFLIFIAQRNGISRDLILLALLWAVGLAVIWFLPAQIASRFQ